MDFAFDDADYDDEGGLVFIVGLVISPTTRLSRKFSTPKEQKIGQNQNLVNCHNSLLTVEPISLILINNVFNRDFPDLGC